MTDARGNLTQYVYDQQNRLAETVDANNNRTKYNYDLSGNLVSVVDRLGRQVRYQYDSRNRQIAFFDAEGNKTRFQYDFDNNVIATIDPLDQRTTFVYDSRDRLTRQIDALEQSTQYRYDAVINRQTQEQWLDGQGNTTRQISYTYDAASQLTAASDPASTYAYTYDLAGRLTRVNNAGTPGVPSVVLSYGYDAVNNLTTVTDTINGSQAGTETVSYDALDRVTQMTQSGAGVAAKRVEMAYDAASQMTGLTRYSDLAGTQSVADTVYDYDGSGRLTSLTHQRGANVIADYGFTYDDANRLTQLTTPDGTSDYSYNNRYELTSSDHSYQSDEAYDYDATGNRTSYTTGDRNRLLNDGTYSYEYDNEGNRTRRVDIATGEATEYTWDYRNRLTSIVSKDGTGTITQTVLYTYDVYDRRLSKSVDADGAGAGAATEEHFVYDGSHIALVFDGAGTLTHRYFHGPQIDQVLAEETAGQTRWALGDHQGSVRDAINNTGTVLNHTTYDSFGQVTGESNPALDFRFGYTGRETDEESDLMYYRARYYDPALGTFVSADPLGFAAGDPNLYRYVFNSPTNFTDPSGEFVGVAVAAGAAVVAVGAAVGIGIVANKQMQTPEAQAAIGGALQGLGNAFSEVAQAQQQLARDVHQNIRDGARQYEALAGGIASAFPTTISIPGAFGPNDGERRPQVTPDLTPVAPNPPLDIGNPNAGINKPSDTRDLIWPGGICKVPGLDGDSKPNLGQPYCEANRGVDIPFPDDTGRLHDPIPKFVPKEWEIGEVEDAIEGIESSIEERKRLMRQLGEDSGHRERLRREEKFLRQLQGRLKDMKGS
ncbi:RHS repeat protein [Nodosilinea sp. LEGE 07088]|nr:RHS repeat protein [Nodosilinea sp. LEGE 07088]